MVKCSSWHFAERRGVLSYHKIKKSFDADCQIDSHFQDCGLFVAQAVGSTTKYNTGEDSHRVYNDFFKFFSFSLLALIYFSFSIFILQDSVRTSTFIFLLIDVSPSLLIYIWLLYVVTLRFRRFGYPRPVSWGLRIHSKYQVG